uniref:Uncharacterized protein n=1 Tax=Meloidogyne javanica TaxID=6303 RepID=A0A915LRZ8_MELJA
MDTEQFKWPANEEPPHYAHQEKLNDIKARFVSKKAILVDLFTYINGRVDEVTDVFELCKAIGFATVDQDHLDKLSNQLKLLKIDDFTINKILKKYKPIKKEVKSEPTDCQVFEAQQQQQPFVGYNGLFELAISQVIQCGYGHVLPLIGTKK